MIEARWALSGHAGPVVGSLLIMADADMRSGRYEGAAIVARSMVEKNPGDAEAWVALGNALVAHAQGELTPAALYAFRRSSEADPNYAAPPFFLGLALARNNRLAEARTMWAVLLARTPKESPLYADLGNRLTQLDAYMAQRDGR
jgi:cytochrome c-type biogenesis protein CcmH